jgi:hypothetical protein
MKLSKAFLRTKRKYLADVKAGDLLLCETYEEYGQLYVESYKSTAGSSIYWTSRLITFLCAFQDIATIIVDLHGTEYIINLDSERNSKSWHVLSSLRG